MKIKSLLIFLTILNIFDKYITWKALQDPDIKEMNPIVQIFINLFGLGMAMIIYMIISTSI